MPVAKEKLKILILGDAKDAEAAFRSASESAKKSMAIIASASAAAATVLVGLTAAVTSTGSEFEQYNIRLRHVLGSTEEGNKLFQDMTTFAGRVPFAFNDIMASATQLAGVVKGGAAEVNGWMPLIADLASVSGLSIQQTTDQVTRMMSAGAASADLFRERGILSMLGFQSGVSYSAEKTKTMLIASWEETGSKFRGTADEMATSWLGITSMMGDKWTLFKKDIGDQGLFDAVKAIGMTINDEIGGSLDDQHKLAKALSDSIIAYTKATALGLASVVDAISGPMDQASSAVNAIWKGYERLPDWAKEVGVIGAILGGKKGVAVVSMFAALGDDVERFGKLMGLVSSYQISFKDAATMNVEEADAAIAKFDARIKKMGSNAADAATGSILIDGSPSGDSARGKVLDFFVQMEANMAKIKSSISSTTTDTPQSLTLPSPVITPGASTAAAVASAAAQQAVDKVISIHQAKFDRIALIATEADMNEQDRALSQLDRELADMDAEKLRIMEMDEFKKSSKQQQLEFEQSFEDARIQTAQTAANQMEKIGADAAKRQALLDRTQMQARLQSTSAMFGDIASLMQSGSKKSFEIGKFAAISGATIDGISAAITAWDKGMEQGGPWVAGAYTIASALKTGAMITKLKSVQYGASGASVSAGGASFPSSGGGAVTSTTSAQPVPFNARPSQASLASAPRNITQQPTTPSYQIVQHINAPNANPGSAELIQAAARLGAQQALDTIANDFNGNGALRQSLAV